jgi:hypothetical protein
MWEAGFGNEGLGENGSPITVFYQLLHSSALHQNISHQSSHVPGVYLFSIFRISA